MNNLKVVAGLTQEQMAQEIERLKAENNKLKQKGSSIKIGAKGNVCVYGLGRFPVSLYQSQWTKLLDMADEIRAFIAANQDKLTTKPGKEQVVDEQVEVA